MHCQLDELEGFETMHDLRLRLATLPATLQHLYDSSLSRICERNLKRAQARSALALLLVAPYSLQLDELAEAAIFNLEGGSEASQMMKPLSLDPDARLIRSSDILGTLGIFASVDRRAGTIQLAHQSVRNFFTQNKAPISQFRFDLLQLHFEVGILCLRYTLLVVDVVNASSDEDGPMNFTTFSDISPRQKKKLEKMATYYPLLSYAAKYFLYHLRNSGKEQDASRLLLSIYSANNHAVLRTWLLLLRSITSHKDFYIPEQWSAENNALYHAAAHGLIAAVTALLDEGADVNALGGSHGGTVLHAACWSERTAVVRLLLSREADYTATDALGDTAYALSLYLRDSDTCRVFLDARKVPLPASVARLYKVSPEATADAISDARVVF